MQHGLFLWGIFVSEPALTLEQVRFRWPKHEADFLAIEGFSLAKGEGALLQGASGSGKSTLLNLIAGTLQAASGQINIAGRCLSSGGTAKRDKIRADEMGIIFQQFNLLPYMSVLDNVLLPLRVSRVRAARVEDGPKEAQRLLGQLGLADLAPNHPVSRLSIGQQQRVAAARALIGAPGLIIADEPTSALDDVSRDAFMRLLMEEAQQADAAILFVSHDTRLMPYFDMIVPIEGFRPQS